MTPFQDAFGVASELVAAALSRVPGDDFRIVVGHAIAQLLVSNPEAGAAVLTTIDASIMRVELGDARYVDLGFCSPTEAQALRRALRDVDAACAGMIKARIGSTRERELARQEQKVAQLLLKRLPEPPPLSAELEQLVDEVSR